MIYSIPLYPPPAGELTPMNQVLRVNNSDPRITYSSGWTTINRRIALSTESGPYTWTSLLDNDFYFLFRGIVPTFLFS